MLLLKNKNMESFVSWQEILYEKFLMVIYTNILFVVWLKVVGCANVFD